MGQLVLKKLNNRDIVYFKNSIKGNNMPKGKNQKVKLIKILEILKRESDFEHPMTTNVLIKKLAEEGVDVERKTLYDDIICLNECGYEVMTIKSTSNCYYIADRTFNEAEVKILLDAINAAKFITESKTIELSDKVASLAGNHKGELLKRNALTFGNAKHTNEKIYYNVDTLQNAIEKEKKVSFRYFHYNVSGGIEYSKGGDSYTVNPVTLCFSNDNYYLIAFNEKYDSLNHFRVDRMDKVTELTDKRVDGKRKTKEIAQYSKKIFSMFGGEDTVVTIKCDNSIIDAVVDKFGEKTIMTKVDENSFSFNAVVAVSPTFFSWCFTFGDKLEILSPKSVVDEIKKQLEEIYKKYQ